MSISVPGERLIVMTTSKKKVSRGAVATARSSVGDAWDKLEKIFEQRVTKVLNTLQIPTHADIQELTSRVEELTRQVKALSAAKAGGDTAPAEPKRRAAGTARKKAKKRKTAAASRKAGHKKAQS